MAAGADLDVVSVDEVESPAPVSPRSRRRTSVLLGAAAVALGLGLFAAFPGRLQLTKSELHGLERQWLTVQAMDLARANVINNELRPAAGPDDNARLDEAIAALDREEVTALNGLHHHVASEFLVDTGVRRLRSAIDHALALKAADLEQVAQFYAAPPPPPAGPPDEQTNATLSAAGRVDVLLVHLFERFSLPYSKLPVAPRPRSADATLAAFNHILDEPTGVRLIVTTGAGADVIDVDANRVTPAHLEGLPRTFRPFTILVRRSYLVLGGNGPFVVAAPRDLNGPVVSLGPASRVVAAANPDEVWLQRQDGTAVEVDGRGDIQQGPVVLPAASFVLGSVDGGLVLASGQSDSSLDVWDPGRHQFVRHIAEHNPQFKNAQHDTVVWVEGGGPHDQKVHLATVSTGQDRTISLGPTTQPAGDEWPFSPDGSQLASAWWVVAASGPTNNSVSVPGFIDIATGQIQLLPPGEGEPPPGPSGMTWSTKGDRIFITNNVGGDDGTGIATYRLGATRIEHLRLKGMTVLAAEVVGPGR